MADPQPLTLISNPWKNNANHTNNATILSLLKDKQQHPIHRQTLSYERPLSILPLQCKYVSILRYGLHKLHLKQSGILYMHQSLQCNIDLATSSTTFQCYSHHISHIAHFIDNATLITLCTLICHSHKQICIVSQAFKFSPALAIFGDTSECICVQLLFSCHCSSTLQVNILPYINPLQSDIIDSIAFQPMHI